LIILERQTKLSELIEQENVVQLDAAVSSTILQQIFYRGSPLHDGAVLIRDGRLAAARIHVPLSDNYHLRKDYGTRHRAAIGASEMGDAIAVVVSEERGTISLTLEGRLYTMDNGDALRTLLHKLLSPARPGVNLGSLGNLFRSSRHKKEQPPDEPGSAGKTGWQDSRPVRPGNRNVKKRRALLLSASLAISIVLWLYVQVTVNPVDTRTFSIPLTFSGVELADRNGVEFAQVNGFEFEIIPQNIQITLQGRKKAIDELASDEIVAYLDCTGINGAGSTKLDVQIDIRGLIYLRPNRISPTSIVISVGKIAVK
jgi:diadenylate cyclase